MSKLTFLFSAFVMIMALNAFAQVRPLPSYQEQVISERVQQTVRMHERVRLSELLRLSPQQERSLEIVSLTILAEGVQRKAQLEVLALGRPIGMSQTIRKQLTEVRIPLPALSRIADLEIVADEAIILDTITAEVRASHQGPQIPPMPMERQPMDNQMLSLSVNANIRVSGEIGLKQLVKQQLGLTLEGAQIARIIIPASVTRGSTASVQVEMNNRIIATKNIKSGSQNAIPLNTIDEVRGNLRLNIRGDVQIREIRIKIGQVRPIQSQHPQRVLVNQEIAAGRPLELSRLLPHENRLISSLTIEASSRSYSAEVALLAMGQVMGSTIVTQAPMRQVIQLMRPMLIRELRLQSLSPVRIEAIEVGFDSYQVW